MTTNQSPAAGDVEAREAAWKIFTDMVTTPGKLMAEVFEATIDAYLAKLAPTGDTKQKGRSMLKAENTFSSSGLRGASKKAEQNQKLLKEILRSRVSSRNTQLTPTKPEPSRIAEIRERHAACERDPQYAYINYKDDPDGIVATAMIVQGHTDRFDLLTELTAIEAERDRMREALEWIRDELPDRDDWDNFEEHSALVLRMRAKARAALKSSKPGEG